MATILGTDNILDLSTVLTGVPDILRSEISTLFIQGQQEQAQWLSLVGIKAQALYEEAKKTENWTIFEAFQAEVKAQQDLYSVEVVGDLPYPMYLTYIEGKLTLLTGQSAIDWLIDNSLIIIPDISPPVLYISATDVTPFISVSNPAGPIELLFAASFSVPEGETRLSNIETLLVSAWKSVTLEVTEESIPSSATSVRYYRNFDTTFRLVKEVII